MFTIDWQSMDFLVLPDNRFTHQNPREAEKCRDGYSGIIRSQWYESGHHGWSMSLMKPLTSLLRIWQSCILKTLIRTSLSICWLLMLWSFLLATGGQRQLPIFWMEVWLVDKAGGTRLIRNSMTLFLAMLLLWRLQWRLLLLTLTTSKFNLSCLKHGSFLWFLCGTWIAYVGRDKSSKECVAFIRKVESTLHLCAKPLFFLTPEIWTSHSAFPFLSRSHVGDNLESFEEGWYFEWFHVMKWQSLCRRKTHHGSDFMVWTGVCCPV